MSVWRNEWLPPLGIFANKRICSEVLLLYPLIDKGLSYLELGILVEVLLRKLFSNIKRMTTHWLSWLVNIQLTCARNNVKAWRGGRGQSVRNVRVLSLVGISSIDSDNMGVCRTLFLQSDLLKKKEKNIFRIHTFSLQLVLQQNQKRSIVSPHDITCVNDTIQ